MSLQFPIRKAILSMCFQLLIAIMKIKIQKEYFNIKKIY